MQPGPPVPSPSLTPRYDAAVRPSKWWYLGAAMVAMVGIAAAIGLFVRGIMGVYDDVNEFQRVSVPGEGTVSIDDPGGHTVYLEFAGANESTTARAPPVDVAITDPDGGPVGIVRYESNVTYETDEHEGIAVYSFDTARAGTYRVTADSTSPGVTVVAIGEGLGDDLIRSIVAAFAAGIIGALVAGAIATVTAVGRSRARRMLPAEPGWTGSYVGPPYPGSSGPYDEGGIYRQPVPPPPPPPPPPAGWGGAPP